MNHTPDEAPTAYLNRLRAQAKEADFFQMLGNVKVDCTELLLTTKFIATITGDLCRENITLAEDKKTGDSMMNLEEVLRIAEMSAKAVRNRDPRYRTGAVTAISGEQTQQTLTRNVPTVEQTTTTKKDSYQISGRYTARHGERNARNARSLTTSPTNVKQNPRRGRTRKSR